MSDTFDNQFNVNSQQENNLNQKATLAIEDKLENVSVENSVEKVVKTKKVEVAGAKTLDQPSRKLPSLVDELLEKNIPVRLSKKGYMVGGFYGLGELENKGFASFQETTKENTLVFFDNKGREHLIESFEDLVKFNNFIWGIFFKLSEDYKKPDLLWFQHMLQNGVLSITPGSSK